MKVYPSYKHHILAAAIENNWTLACRLLVEHEERLAAHPKATFFQKAVALIQHYLAQRKFNSADADYIEKCRLFDTAERNYQEVGILVHLSYTSNSIIESLENVQTINALHISNVVFGINIIVRTNIYKPPCECFSYFSGKEKEVQSGHHI